MGRRKGSRIEKKEPQNIEQGIMRSHLKNTKWRMKIPPTPL
jgi:hypothetical protein